MQKAESVLKNDSEKAICKDFIEINSFQSKETPLF